MEIEKGVHLEIPEYVWSDSKMPNVIIPVHGGLWPFINVYTPIDFYKARYIRTDKMREDGMRLYLLVELEGIK